MREESFDIVKNIPQRDTQATSKELNIFCDASETAIAAVAHTHLTDSSGHQRLGFILGQAKLAPKHGHMVS
jgi:hypothetical protein